MYKINYRNLAVVLLILAAIIIFYKEPSWVVELFYPDHFSDRAKPDDSMVFVLCLLGVIGGSILVLLESGNKKEK